MTIRVQKYLLDRLPRAKYMLADRGYDADWFRNGLGQKGIEPCLAPKKNREINIPYDKK